MARGCRRGFRVRDILRAEEPDVHVLRRKLGRLRVEVLVKNVRLSSLSKCVTKTNLNVIDNIVKRFKQN